MNFRKRTWLIEPYRVLSRLFMPIACLLYGKTLVCVGVSISHMSNALSRFSLRNVLKCCAHISVREPSSEVELHRLLVNVENGPEMKYYPDISFALLREYEPKAETTGTDTPRSIALTLVDWQDSGLEARSKYIQALVEFIEYAAQEYDARFVIIPQVIKQWEAADYITKKILSNVSNDIRNRISLAKVKHGMNGVVEIYKQSDFLIATRMHSAIFALCIGTPVIAIAYDKGSKWGILNELGCGDYLMHYEAMDGKDLISRFESFCENRADIMRQVRKHVEKQMNLVDECVLGFQKFLSLRCREER